MTRNARAVVAILFGAAFFVVIGALAGSDKGIYDHGCQCVHRGWSGAWRVGGIALAVELLFLLAFLAIEWVMRGDD